MQDGVKAIGDSLFINTTYSFNSAVSSTYKYAHDLIVRDGGKADEKSIRIKVQKPSAPVAEESLSRMLYSTKQYRFSIRQTGSLKAAGNRLK